MIDITQQKMPAWVEPFLKELAVKGIVGSAARAAGVTRRATYFLRDQNEEFRLRWEDAVQEAADRMEEELDRRGVEGIEEPVFGRITRDQDGQIGTIRRYSDTLLIFALKGIRPEKYREKHEVQNTGTIQIQYVNDWRSGMNQGEEE